MKHYEDDRILEALQWLYGGEFDPPEPWVCDPDYLIFEGSRQSVYLNTKTDQWFVGNAGVRFGITGDIAHALEVTAPWEWNSQTYASELFFAQVKHDLTSQTWNWSVTIYNGPVICELEDSADAAKLAARAAYLRWMRGAKP